MSYGRVSFAFDDAWNQPTGYLLPNALAERNLASRIPEAGHQSEPPTDLC